jgi:cyclase
MRGKKILLGISLVLASVLVFAGTSFCQTAHVMKKLSDHVYLYGVEKDFAPTNSFGANCGVIVGTDAVLVVDTLISAKDAEKFRAEILKLTDKPIKYVVNTHYHLDHAWGNEVFERNGAVVIGHENSRVAAPKSEYGLAHYNDFGLTSADMEGTVLKFPTVTFWNSMRVDLGGGVLVDLSYPGASHTDGSITALVTPDKALFLGDILFTKCHPYLGEGDIPSWIKVLANFERTKAAFIIPGHGPLSTIADIKDMEAYLKDFAFFAKTMLFMKGQQDAVSLAQQFLKKLPQQGRNELSGFVESSLREKYLPKGVLGVLEKK